MSTQLAFPFSAGACTFASGNRRCSLAAGHVGCHRIGLRNWVNLDDPRLRDGKTWVW